MPAYGVVRARSRLPSLLFALVVCSALACGVFQGQSFGPPEHVALRVPWFAAMAGSALFVLWHSYLVLADIAAMQFKPKGFQKWSALRKFMRSPLTLYLIFFALDAVVSPGLSSLGLVALLYATGWLLVLLAGDLVLRRAWYADLQLRYGPLLVLVWGFAVLLFGTMWMVSGGARFGSLFLLAVSAEVIGERSIERRMVRALLPRRASVLHAMLVVFLLGSVWCGLQGVGRILRHPKTALAAACEMARPSGNDAYAETPR